MAGQNQQAAIQVHQGDLSVVIRQKEIELIQDGNRITLSWQRFSRFAAAAVAITEAHSTLFYLNAPEAKKT